MIFLQIVILLASLLLIIKGGDLFVAAAVRIAEFLRMPHVVIGSTLVSLATTVPEMTVSVMAGSQGASDLAVGNAVGSCICNVALILGLTAAIKRVNIHLRSVAMPLISMLLCAAVLWAFTINGVLSRTEAAFILAIGAAYFVWDFFKHMADRKRKDVAEAKEIEKEEVGVARKTWFETRTGTIIQFLTGAAIVIVGSKFMVNSAIFLAQRMGIPQIVIGLTVVAVGTSLPELVTAMTSARRNVSDLSVGNVLGANVANLTLVVGLAGVMSVITMDKISRAFNFISFFIVMGAFTFFAWRKGMTRRNGFFMLGLYAAFIAALIWLTIRMRGG